MKVAIVGSRNFTDFEFLKLTMTNLGSSLFVIDKIISGGAEGVDRFAEWYTITNDIPTKIFLPDWDLYSKSAGMKRNGLIVANADIVVAFWDGKSKGTKNSIDTALKAKKTCLVFMV